MELTKELTNLSNNVGKDPGKFIVKFRYEPEGRLVDLSLDFSGIESINVDLFENYKSLNFLTIAYCELPELPALILEPLKELKMLRIVRSKISRLNPKLLSKLSKLYRFELILTSVMSISDNFFENSQILEVIDLGKNEFSELPTKLFTRNTKLKEIYLGNNKLTSISLDHFANLSDLIRLDLSNNHLTIIPTNLFMSLKSLYTVNFKGNTELPKFITKEFFQSFSENWITASFKYKFWSSKNYQQFIEMVQEEENQHYFMDKGSEYRREFFLSLVKNYTPNLSSEEKLKASGYFRLTT